MSLIKTTKHLQRLLDVKQDGIYGPVTAAAAVSALNVSISVMDTTVASITNHRFDARTETNLSTLTDGAQKKVRPFMAHAQSIAASMGYDYITISGHRSYAEQDALYAKGRTKPGPRVTNARGGSSNHNFGIAFDNGVFKNGKYLDADDPKAAHRVHAAVAQVARKYGIEWGGNWRSFKDTPHFEVRTGLSMTQKRAAVLAGRSLV